MVAYHVSPNGPSLCRAEKGRCPYGADGENHFATVEQASAFYEKRMVEAFGGLEAVKKTNSQIRKEKVYQLRDNGDRMIRRVKNSPTTQTAVLNIQKVRTAPATAKAALATKRTAAWGKLASGVAYAKEKFELSKAKALKVRDRYSAYVKVASTRARSEADKFRTAVNDALENRAEVRKIEQEYGGKLRKTDLANVQKGDRLSNGNVVASIKDANGSTAITTRNTVTGRFGATLKVGAGEKVAVLRPRRSLLRTAGSMYSTARTASANRVRAISDTVRSETVARVNETKRRVKIASDLQRQVFRAISGVDRTVIATVPEHLRPALAETRKEDRKAFVQEQRAKDAEKSARDAFYKLDKIAV